MSDAATAGSSEAPAPAAPRQSDTPGELLKRAREQQGITLQQAAEDLHLDLRLVAAIEANRFAELGAPVYARGHLRKYATLLGLSPQQVIQCYEALTDTPAVPTPVPTAGVARERPRLAVPLGLGALALVMIVAWLAVERDDAGRRQAAGVASAAQDTGGVAEAPSVVAAADAGQTPTPAVDDEPEAPADDAAPAAVEPAASPAPVGATVAALDAPAAGSEASAAPPPAGAVRLDLAFTEPCWVEVYDGSGARLLFEIGQPGTARSVAGAAPLEVVLGLAGAVTARVNDEPIVIPRIAGRDATRFRIAGDGQVQ